jgi:DMSO/TMAO reductase YedYZ molybdopterin-dependent catalytic subunit
MSKNWLSLFILLALAACRPATQISISSVSITETAAPQTALAFTPDPYPDIVPSATISEKFSAEIEDCQPPSIVVPTLPAEIPDYTKVDSSTGLHITGTFQQIDLATYLLKVTGKVDNPLNLTMDQIRCLPKVESAAPLICPGVFQDHARWSGTPIHYLLDLAGVQSDATVVNFIGVDGYTSNVSIAEANANENFLAYEWNGQPLPILHGFPIRAVFPAMQGYKWVKWLVEIEVK